MRIELLFLLHYAATILFNIHSHATFSQLELLVHWLLQFAYIHFLLEKDLIPKLLPYHGSMTTFTLALSHGNLDLAMSFSSTSWVFSTQLSCSLLSRI